MTAGPEATVPGVLDRLRRRSSPYDARLRMTGREWLMHLYGELMERETRWIGARSIAASRR